MSTSSVIWTQSKSTVTATRCMFCITGNTGLLTIQNCTCYWNKIIIFIIVIQLAWYNISLSIKPVMWFPVMWFTGHSLTIMFLIYMYNYNLYQIIRIKRSKINYWEMKTACDNWDNDFRLPLETNGIQDTG